MSLQQIGQENFGKMLPGLMSDQSYMKAWI